MEFVESSKNRADSLTRVKREWSHSVLVDIERIHDRVGHPGVQRTMEAINLTGLNISKKEVAETIRHCNQCISIDPASLTWERGILEVDTNWTRVALDVTHYGSRLFLSAIYCGPSRFTVWKKINSEAGPEITDALATIFAERGPLQKILLDNSKTFHSNAIATMCGRWKVFRRFRAAHRPSGNGIVERVHRTIKQMAAQTGRSIVEQTFCTMCKTITCLIVVCQRSRFTLLNKFSISSQPRRMIT